MPQPRLNAQRARRYTRIAQIGALALAVSAAGLWAVEVRGVRPEAEPPTPTPPPELVEAPPEPAVPPLDELATEGLAFRLEEQRPPFERPKPAEQQETSAATSTDEPAVDEPAPGGGEWRFLGAIIEPARRVALVSIDGRQRMLVEGREVDDTRVVRIEPDRMVISRGGVEQTIRVQERKGAAVAYVKMPEGAPGAPAVPAGIGANPGQNGGMRRNFANDPRFEAERQERIRLFRERMARREAERRRMELEGE